MSYDENCYDDAENYWEKAARNGHNRAKKALLNLYKNELKDKYDYTSRTSYVEAKGRGCRNFYDDYNKTGGYEI